MDIISQLQEQVNKIASIAFNTFGTLQRDAPPVRLSTSYPEPPSNPSGSEETVNIAEQTKVMSAALVHAAKQVCMFSREVGETITSIITNLSFFSFYFILFY